MIERADSSVPSEGTGNHKILIPIEFDLTNGEGNTHLCFLI